MQAKNEDIERLRGVAVTMVVLFHVPLFKCAVPSILLGAWSGVELFFVVSGVVVGKSWLGALPPFPTEISPVRRVQLSLGALLQFYWRRIFRILPLAWICAALTIAAHFLYNKYGFFLTFGPRAAFSELYTVATFQYNFGTIRNTTPGLLVHYWSLAVEEQFYLVLPLFLVLITGTKARLKWLVGISALTILVLRPWVVPSDLTPGQVYSWIHTATQNRLDGLLLGACLSVVHHEWDRRGPAYSLSRLATRALPIIAIALILALWCSPTAFAAPYSHCATLTVNTLISLTVVAIASADKNWILPWPVVNPFTKWLGARSYALYLFHIPCWYFYQEFQARHPGVVPSPWIALFTWTLFTMTIVELAHRLIEKPLIAFARKNPPVMPLPSSTSLIENPIVGNQKAS